MYGFYIYTHKDNGIMCYIIDTNKIIIYPSKSVFYIFLLWKKHFIYLIDDSQLYIIYFEYRIEVSKMNSANYNIDFNSFSGLGFFIIMI